ncbi:MAG: D-alanyl-D-alanine carboxypeptidase [Firmicutes bacterium]|nr:D-alanyl-D-alanine carboxypeptidase [Bacillota bacterium]
MKHTIKKRPRRKLFMYSILPLALASLMILSLLFVSFRTKIYSSQYLLIRSSDGMVIDAHNETKQAYPASLTKIMTALLAIEHTSDFSEVITVPEAVFDKVYKTGASVAGFESGELATLEELLYGIMLPSGAECCLAYAEYIASSETEFVSLMNRKANELGMDDTYFTNCTGLHSADHYSTAKDLAILLRYALENETFRTLLTSDLFYVTPSAVHSDGFYLRSTLSEALDRCENPLPKGLQILGGKTGYTSDAGLCLASLAEVNGEEYILITLGAEGSPDSLPYHVMDAVTLYSRELIQ